MNFGTAGAFAFEIANWRRHRKKCGRRMMSLQLEGRRAMQAQQTHADRLSLFIIHHDEDDLRTTRPFQNQSPLSNTMSSSPSTAEARFLESREKRFQERSNRSKHHRPNNDDVVSFWKCTRDMLQQWSDRLHDIIPENDNRTCLTAAQRIRTEAQLDSLLLELQQLRKQCLLVNDESRDFELPLADVRLLHEEFTKHAMKLDTVRQQLCPPTKFVFKRYRAAMRERAENEEVNDVLETQVVTHQHDDRDTARQEKPQQVTHRGNVVEKYSDNTIVVQQDGSIRVQQKGTDEQTTTIISPSNDGEVSSSSSLLLQDLQNCDVTLYVLEKCFIVKSFLYTFI
jgi:hypothetical protein